MGLPNPPKVYAKETTGRPSKFTPERRASIIDAISHRIPYEMAAEAHGISVETLYDWLRTAKNHRDQGIESDYTLFSEALKSTEMNKVKEHNEKIASNVDRWQADAWILERRWHKHYSPNAQLNEMNQKLDKLLESEPQHGQERKELEEG